MRAVTINSEFSLPRLIVVKNMVLLSDGGKYACAHCMRLQLAPPISTRDYTWIHNLPRGSLILQTIHDASTCLVPLLLFAPNQLCQCWTSTPSEVSVCYKADTRPRSLHKPPSAQLGRGHHDKQAAALPGAGG